MKNGEFQAFCDAFVETCPETLKSNLFTNLAEIQLDFSEYCKQLKERFQYVCPKPFRFKTYAEQAVDFCIRYKDRCPKAKVPDEPVPFKKEDETHIYIREIESHCKSAYRGARSFCFHPELLKYPKYAIPCALYKMNCIDVYSKHPHQFANISSKILLQNDERKILPMMIHPLWAVLIPATLAISTPPVARPIATGRYNEMLKRQQAERESIEKTMRQYGVAPAGLLSDTSNAREVIEERPKSPFGDLRPLPGREESPPRSNKARAVQDSLAEVAMQPPSRTVPRPENQELHRKAMALEALCSRFLPTVRKHCVGERTAKEYQKRCAGYFHVCTE
ncbi:unnamed protein product [Nippostrongylus brasiliensis]|uniref:CX9C domain-containing protein n=1 Tax=Nippostrongylus brasiliensis TaxID=27835 RepID=A0A0N4Y265_NIPBR|nr:unnamed protein product [Nippostrongylus brasiliensis]